jgi:hypothetical protein
MLLMFIIGLLLFLFFPKLSSHHHKNLYYEKFGGSALDNYGRKCDCIGIETDRSTEYDHIKYCYGIPLCRNFY